MPTITVKKEQSKSGVIPNPVQEISVIDGKMPFLMFPVRIETKFLIEPAKSRLLVRIFPDNIAITSFEEGLTEQEVTDLEKYWDFIDEHEDNKKKAWHLLVNNYGVHRAAYLHGLGKDFKKNILKPESWSFPPRSYVMPDFFEVLLYRKSGGNNGHEIFARKTGAEIPDPLFVGPDPRNTTEINNENFDEEAFGKEARWMFDFEEAKKFGMALEFDLSALSATELKQGFSRVVAVGIKRSADGSLLKNLFNHHHYTEGLSFVKQGTPSKITEGNTSGLNTSESNTDNSYKLEVEAALISDDQNLSDPDKLKNGVKFGQALGMSDHDIISTFNKVSNADLTEDEDARCMAEIIWYAVLSPYLGLYPKSLSDADKESVRDHFIDFVRGRGKFPAMLCGDTPYGFLPASSLKNWEPSGSFENAFRLFMQKLQTEWQKMADDKDKVPVAGTSNDPLKEFIRILGMEPIAHEIRIRSLLSNNYIRKLMKFSWSGLFSRNPLLRRIYSFINNSKLNKIISASYPKWEEGFDKNIEESKRKLQGAIGNGHTELSEMTPWGNSFLPGIPNIQSEPLSEKKTLSKKYSGNNYIQVLSKCNFQNLKNNPSELFDGEVPDCLLYILIRQAIINKGSKWSNNNNPLTHLARLSSANLDRLLRETLDLCSHRLDAWITSLFNKRMLSNIENQNQGIGVGAYGWMENLVPKTTEKPGGYIHAPSIDHGTTAAVLRNAYLTHADRENAERMAVNLSSERMRKALWLLQGIRQGQSLSVLLGYRFERNLHELKTLNLDKFIYPFRKLFPVGAGDETTGSKQASEYIPPDNVVDGLALLDAYKRGEIPYKNDPDLRKATKAEKQAIEKKLDDLDETFDAIADLSLAESVHQTIQGNYLRAGAVLNMTSADGSPPDEFAVCKTPRGGVDISHHLLLLFNHEENGETGIQGEGFWPGSYRAGISPELNNWAAQVFGNPEKIIFQVKFFEDGDPELKVEKINMSQMIFILKDDEAFGLAPIDLIYEAGTYSRNESSALKEKLKYFSKRIREAEAGKSISVEDVELDDFLPENDEKSLGSLMVLAKALHTLIANAGFLKPEDLMLPEDTEGEIPESDDKFLTTEDFEKFKEIIKHEFDRFKELRTGLEKKVDDIKNEILENPGFNPDILDGMQVLKDLVKIIEELNLFDIPHCFPAFTKFNGLDAVTEIANQAEMIERSLAKRIEEIEEVLEETENIKNKIPELNHSDLQRDLINELFVKGEGIAKLLFGKSFTAFPQFFYTGLSEDNQLSVNESDLRLWLQKAAFTHQPAKRLDTMNLFFSNSGNELKYSVYQISHNGLKKWVAETMTPNEKQKLQGALSLVIASPDDLDWKKPVSGMVLEKWNEIIPNDEELSSLVYNYDAPGNEAPQVCLYCISPLADGKWQWEHLVSSVEETMDMFRIRTVDTDAIKHFGRYIPGLVFKSTFSEEDKSYNFTIS